MGVEFDDDWIRKSRAERGELDEPPPQNSDDAELARMDYEAHFALEVSREAYKLQVRDAARRKVAREQREDLTRPRLVRLDEFLAREHDDPTYRIDRLWPTGGRVLLSAQWKAGKTTLSGNLIRSLADGDPFLDHFDVRPARRIVLIDNELDERTLQSWLADQGVTNTAAVHLLSLRGRVSTFDIFDDDARAEWAKDLAGADVVILDCLRPILDAFGLDENHEVGRFLVPFDALLAELGQGEAVLVHHMGHGPERSRGDSRLMDWPDALWKLVRDKDEDDETMDDPDGARYFSAYGRDVSQPQAELAYDPHTRHITLGSHAQNRRQASAHRKIVRTDETVMAVVTENPGINKSKLRAACASKGGHNPDTDAAVERLVATGMIRRQIVGRSHFHHPGEALLNGMRPDMPDRAQNGAGMYVPVPFSTGTTHTSQHSGADAPSAQPGHICPHGVPNGDQPDDFLRGRLPCVHCRSEAMSS